MMAMQYVNPNKEVQMSVRSDMTDPLQVLNSKVYASHEKTYQNCVDSGLLISIDTGK